MSEAAASWKIGFVDHESLRSALEDMGFKTFGYAGSRIDDFEADMTYWGPESKCGDTITSGLGGAWSVNPIAWTTQYLDNLFGFEWVQTKSPAARSSGFRPRCPFRDEGTYSEPRRLKTNCTAPIVA